MNIKHLSIKNFRGIQNMSWIVPDGVVCLVGPGDSTKTTILDAIELVLLPRWNPIFDDTDFYKCVVNNPIEIICTVGNVPEELINIEKFGAYLRGWNTSGLINDEPMDGDEIVITIKLTVDEHLEPLWHIITDRHEEGKEIHQKDRERLGMSRIGSNVEKHLSWGVGSTLRRITKKTNKPSSELVKVSRMARATVKLDNIEEFISTSDIAKNAVALFGVKPKDGYAAHLDPKGITTGIGSIVIADGNIPIRSMGLGSRRLFALAIQSHIVPDGAIYLIDEVESGLEPHRIRHLLRTFISLIKKDGLTNGQVIMTSHSSVVIAELEAQCLCVVRSKEGTTIVKSISKDLQSTVRSISDSFLARKVLITEGRTEYGMTRSLDIYWQRKGKDSFAFAGLISVDGVGHSAPKKALDLAELGYDAALFIDSDKLTEIVPSIKELKDKGVKIFHWAGEVATEEEVFNCLPWEGVEKLLQLACSIKGESSIYDSICNVLGGNRVDIAPNLRDHYSEDVLRKVIGKKAKSQGWFKSIGNGESFGNIVVTYLDKIPKSSLSKVIEGIQTWAHE